MNQIRPFFILLSAGLAVNLLSCSHIPASRKIASTDQQFQEELIKRYELQETLRFMGDEKDFIHRQALSQTSNGSDAHRKELELLQKYEKDKNNLEGELRQLSQSSRERNKSFGSTYPEIYLANTSLRFRHLTEEFKLKDWDHFAALPGHYPKYPVELHNSKEVKIKLSQYFDTSYAIMNNDQRYIWTTVSCEGPYKLKTAFIHHKFKAGESERFRFYNSSKNSQRVVLTLTPETGSCQMSFEDKGRSSHGLAIVPMMETTPIELKQFTNQFEYCLLPQASNATAVQKLFTSSDFESMTCPQSFEEVTLLDQPLNGLKQKAKILLGQDLPPEMIENFDPYYPLDFSNAPKLDAIYISYLVWRRDFSGTVIERLVRHHAENGAQIKILVSDVIALEKDKIMLDQLKRDFPSNVQVRYYKYDVDNNKDFKDFFSEFHRTMHVKLFLVHSSENAKDNAAVLGGRNIHDGFVFDTQPDLSRYPELVQYGEDESFAKWTDFEILIKNQQLVETLMGQYMALYEYDPEAISFRSFTLNERATRPLDPGYFIENRDQMLYRHLISIPYRDNMALEKYMVSLFDSAMKTITISTPYFNLTPEIIQAVERAIQRGVKIELITRLEFKGDTADIILSDVNKKAVNKFVDHISVYEFTKPSDILHSKLVLIDGVLTTVGSVNFNQRSFYHDLENTLIVYSPEFNARIKEVIEGYKKNTRPISDEQKPTLWKSLIINIFHRAL